MAANEVSLSFEAKTPLPCAIFVLCFTRQDAKEIEKSGTLQFFFSLIKYIVNV